MGTHVDKELDARPHHVHLVEPMSEGDVIKINSDVCTRPHKPGDDVARAAPGPTLDCGGSGVYRPSEMCVCCFVPTDLGSWAWKLEQCMWPDGCLRVTGCRC